MGLHVAERAVIVTFVFGIGTQELLIMLAIVVLIFGARRLPQLGRSFASAVSNFRRGVTDEDEEPRVQAPAQQAINDGDRDGDADASAAPAMRNGERPGTGGSVS